MKNIIDTHTHAHAHAHARAHTHTHTADAEGQRNIHLIHKRKSNNLLDQDKPKVI